jgi:hypothetical protein
MSDLARSIIADWEEGSSDKTTTLTLWQQIANYMLPNRNDYLVTKTPGQKRMTYIYDAMPVWAAEQFAAGVHSLLTSQSLQWFALHADDDRVNADDDVRAWLDGAAATMYSIFNGSRQNFASQSYEMFLDLGTIGSACMGVLDSQRSGILFTTRHMKECIWRENEEDRIDTNIRQWEYTAKQAYQAWGKRAGGKVVEAYGDSTGKGLAKKFTFLHAVRPRKNRDPQRADNRNMAWESVYVSVADQEEISVSGFTEFPYLCPRAERCSNETYGRGRGTINLPDVQMLNELKKLVVKAAQKVIDPPLQVPDDGFLMNIKTVPGSMNFYRATLPAQARIEPIKTGGEIQIGVEMINTLQAQISRMFYVDMLRMPTDPQDPASEGKGITATYWLQRRDKEMMMLSPMLARMQAEALGPLIDRVFAMLWRKSKARKFGPGSPFKPPPPALSGVPLHVEYVSPIALAQKSTQMDGIERLMQIQGQLRQLDAQSALIIDGEAILRIASRNFNAPVAALKSADQLQEEAQQRAQAEAQMNAHEALANVAGAAKDGASALKSAAQAQDISGGNDNGMQEAA